MDNRIALEQALQQRFGPLALRPLAALVSAGAIEIIPTGFPTLDAALGIGGIPCGHVTTLVGGGTSGITTLTYQVIASCQQRGGYCAYVDVDTVFAPDIALRYSIDLDALLLIHPIDPIQALNITRDLVASHAVQLVVLDWIGQTQQVPLQRLTNLLAQSHTALVILTNMPNTIIGSDGLRLRFAVVEWRFQFGDVVGYRSEVTMLHNKLAPVVEPVHVDFAIEGL